MFPARALLELIIQTLPMYFLQPELLAVAGVVILLVYRQYRRVAALESRLLGRPKASAGRRTALSLLYGLAGGVVGTAAFVLLGLSLTDAGIWYLWPVAIALFFLHPRFLCFAYAGGIVSVSHLLTGWPDLYVPSLMALVAVLHFVEAILIALDGASLPTPVIVRRAAGDVVGGFSLQKFWPLPFVAMIGLLLGGDLPAETPGEGWLDMPAWWPLIAGPRVREADGQWVYLLLPVMAALGYGDIALVRSPRSKAYRTSLALLGYSLGLMALAFAGHYAAPWTWVAALFSPLAHEAVIALGRRSEEGDPPLYTKGLRPSVLDVLPGSPADRIGLRPGDEFVAVNGRPVFTNADVRSALLTAGTGVRAFDDGGAWPAAPAITVSRNGRTYRLPWPERTRLPLGLLLVPDRFDFPLVDLADRSRYARFVKGVRMGWRRLLHRTTRA